MISVLIDVALICSLGYMTWQTIFESRKNPCTVPLQKGSGTYLYLIAVAVTYILLGLGIFFDHSNVAISAFSVVREIASPFMWGLIFTGIGAIAAIAAFSYHKVLARITVILASTFSAIWALSFIVASLQGNIKTIATPIGWTFVTITHLIAAGNPYTESKKNVVKVLNECETRRK